MRTTVIEDCDVLDVLSPDCPVHLHHDVVVRDGRITDVAPTGDQFPCAPATRPERIDGRGLLAVPGLVNAHTHSPMVLMRGVAEDVGVDDWFNRFVWPMEVNLTPERVYLGARLACAEMLLSGVTTFLDHYFHADRIAAAVTELGIRAQLAPTFFSSGGVHSRQEALEAALALAATSARVTAALGPHATYTVSDDDLELTAQQAVAHDLRVHVHAAETGEQTEASVRRLGVTPIEVLRRTGVLDAGALIAHGCGVSVDDVEILAGFADRTAVAYCPKVYLKHALHPTTPVTALDRAGVPVAVGTDGAAGHNTLDVWEALRLTALTVKHQDRDGTAMSLAQTLRAATVQGAAAAGLSGQIGAIAPGYRADIVLVDLSGPHCQPVHDPRAALVYSARASDVVTVLVDGDVVVRDRLLVQADLAEVIEAAGRVATSMTDTSSGQRVQHYAP